MCQPTFEQVTLCSGSEINSGLLNVNPLYPSGYCMYTNPTFSPHSVFMCFVWISEQTAIISLYSITMTSFYNRDSVFTARYGVSSDRAQRGL